MPRFYQFVETEVDVDISIREFVEECDNDDIERLIKLLKEGGYLRGNVSILEDETSTIQEMEMKNSLTKIFENRLSLSMEEEEMIKNISKKF